MNQVSQSINPIKLLNAHAGFAATPRIEGVARRPRVKSLRAIMSEVRGSARSEERVWFVLALSTLGVLFLSLWL